VKIQISTPDDFSFLECVNAHGWKNLFPFCWDEGSACLTRVHNFGTGGPRLITISSGDEVVHAEAEGAVAERQFESAVRAMLQLDVTITEFHSYCTADSNLCHIPALKQGRLLRSPTVFEDVVKVIATTNTTWAQTKGMVSRLVNHFGSPLESDPSRRSFPTPEQIAAVTVDEFSEKAKMGYRSNAVHKISSDVAEGRLDLEILNDPSIASADLYKELLALPGVGPYAASCLIIYLGRYDRVNVDSWARTLVGNELGRKVSDKEVHDFFDRYGEWKALVYHFYPWAKNGT
jgi:3-methyladenine DNA glycosylase/8-oxoguanine DNA glycosylase